MVLAEKISVSTVEFPATENRKKYIRASKRQKAQVLGVIGLLLIAVFGNVIVQALVIQQNQQINQLEKLISNKNQEMVKLRMELARLESFDRIQQVAQADLGMRVAGPDDYYMIKTTPNPGTERHLVDLQLASAETGGGLWGKFKNWLGDFGQTMAQTP